MIDLQKLIADCDFHIKRGDNMSMPPKLLKELAERLLVEDDEFEKVQTGRDFEAEQVEAAKALQPAPDVKELVEALQFSVGVCKAFSTQSHTAKLAMDIGFAALAKHGGRNG